MRHKSLAQFDAGLALPANASAGRLLTSDASGNGTWADPVVPVGSAFPVAPVDGQEFDLRTLDMGVAGVVWRFRFRAANSWWEFVGGAPMITESGSTFSTASTTYVDSGLSQDLPYPGRYDVRVEALASTAAVATNSVLMSPGTTSGNDQWAAVQATPVATANSALIQSTNRIDFTNAYVKQWVRSSSGGAGTVQLVRQRKIIVTPVRIPV